MFKKIFSKLINFFKFKWAYILSLIFIWVIPIIMLNEYVALTETNISFKITFMGCLVCLVILFAFRKKFYALIHQKPHGWKRGVLLCLHKAVTYGLCLGVLWAVSTFSGKFYTWWLLCGISIFFGLICILIDEILSSKRAAKEGK